MSQAYIRSSLGALPVVTEIKDGAIGQINAVAAGEIAVYRNGAWVLLTRSGTGTVTLAGDVTGPSSANTVVGLTGAGGIVAMHAQNFFPDAAFLLQPLDQTGPGFTVRISGGTSTGSIGGNLRLYGGDGVTTGNVDIGASSAIPGLNITGTQVTSYLPVLEFRADIGAVELRQASGAGVRDNLIISASASSDDLGGSLQLRGGAGGAAGEEGDVSLMCGSRAVFSGIHSAPNPIATVHVPSVRWTDDVLSPILFQAQRVNDSGVPQPLSLRAQDPYAGATDHGGGNDARVAGNMFFYVGESVNGADQIAHFAWTVANQLKTEIWTDRIELYDQFIHFNPDLSAAEISLADAVAAPGHSLTISAGRGDTGQRGGDIILRGGVPGAGESGGGLIVKTGNDARSMFQSVQFTSRFVTAIGFQNDLAAGDLPVDTSNVLLLANAYNLDSVIAQVGPTGAILIGSASGMPVFQGSDGNYIILAGTFHSGPVGASAGFYDVQINGIDLCFEAFFRS
jgi:hypothetical protein